MPSEPQKPVEPQAQQGIQVATKQEMARPLEASDYFTVDDKEEGFVYRWVNSKDRNMLQKRREGWEVDSRPDNDLPAQIQAMGQSIANPGGGTVRQRGDVILMRMPRERFETKVRLPKLEARERQRISVDTMVAAANDEAKAALKRRGYDAGQIRANHAFSGSPDGKF